MNKRVLFFFSLPLVLSLHAAPLQEDPLLLPRENEMGALEHLIQSTERKLETQKQLKALMQTLRAQEDRFFQGDQSKQHAGKLVHSARQVLEIIKENHLEHLFTSAYLQELALFSSIAGKSVTP